MQVLQKICRYYRTSAENLQFLKMFCIFSTIPADFLQRTESKSWSGKNDIVPRTPRFSNHVVKGGMKTTGKGSPAAREPIVNKTRNTSDITKDNTVKTTGNGSTNIGDLIMPRIRSRSGKDFVTKNKEK